MTKYFLICAIFAVAALLPLQSCNNKSDKESQANSAEWLDNGAVTATTDAATTKTATTEAATTEAATTEAATTEAATTEAATTEAANSENNEGANDDKSSTKASLPTVIDFYATWCGPCKQIAPIFDQLKVQYNGQVKFVSIDIDTEQDMAEKYGIEAVPTFVLLDPNGKEVERVIGADVESLREAVRKISQQ